MKKQTILFRSLELDICKLMSSIIIYSAKDKVFIFALSRLRSKIMSIALKPFFTRVYIESYFFVVNAHWVHWEHWE